MAGTVQSEAGKRGCYTPTRMSGARGVVAVQEAQWVAHLRRTLKEAVAETLHERPRPEKPRRAIVKKQCTNAPNAPMPQCTNAPIS